ncbi:MAG TPA: serine hydrolase [Bacteroidota bacterium]|nr:serine hydrolase [Bacteroidota bacterium]
MTPKYALKLAAIVPALFCLTSVVLSQTKPELIDSLLKVCVANGQFNGSALVAEDGTVIFKKGYGMANFDWGIPNAPDTKHRIASITKQFTATLIMQLVEKNKIKVGEKITTYLPDYRKDTGDKVTVHHLLTHTSGIPNYTSLPGFWSDSTRNPYSIEYLIKNFCSGDLEFEPGSKYNYCNSGYVLLGAIIEKVTGKPYVQMLEENILKPVGMKNSGIEDESFILANRSYGYLKNAGQRVRDPYFRMQNAWAAGAMYSTVEDLYRWDQALYFDDKLLTRKSKSVYFAPHIESGGGGFYAYGWGIAKYALGQSPDSVTAIVHTGGLNGYNTIILRVPETKDLVVLFNNSGPAPLGGMCKAILGILHGKPFLPPKLGIVDTLMATTVTEGVEAAVKRYGVLKSTAEEKYDFAEVQLNVLGYQLLALKRVKDAIRILQLNVELFPEAFNTYDSLGESYMIDGQKELAIKNYAKSLELNPGNSGAITMLKRIQEMK